MKYLVLALLFISSVCFAQQKKTLQFDSGNWKLDTIPTVKGDKGDIGLSGSNGSNGSAGATGSQGIQGLTGTTGSNGSNGSQGTQGQAATCYTRTAGQAPITYTPIVYTSKFLTNNSGIVIDTLTTNGSASGTAIFTHIYSVQISGKYAGTTVSISSQSYTVAGNLKTINVNVAAGVTAVLSLATLGLVGSGVEISLLIIGD